MKSPRISSPVSRRNLALLKNSTRSSLLSYSIFDACPSMNPPSPSCLRRKVAGLPVATPYWNPSSSCRTTIRSARIKSDPCVNTTLPSNVAVFLASSAVMLSDSMVRGFSRSARSASAGAAGSAAIAARAKIAAHRLLFKRRIEGAFDLRLQRELLLVLVDDHADPGKGRVTVGNRDRLIAAQDAFFREHVQEFRPHAKFWLLGRCLAQE